MEERYTGLRAVIIDDGDSKAELIRVLLSLEAVPYLGRLASMSQVETSLAQYRQPSGPAGLFAEGNLFFVDGKLSSDSTEGQDGGDIVTALAEAGIAQAASYLVARRGQTPTAHGIVFGCSDDIGTGAFERAVLGYNLHPGALDVETELVRMLDLAVELLPANAMEYS